VLDNGCNSSAGSIRNYLREIPCYFQFCFLECLKRVEQITGCKVINYKIDCLDLESLRDIFKKHSIYAIINCAALKSVGESVKKPILYYKNNIGCLVNLLSVIVLN
jgi:UDP-glucose 4-epimerase